MGKAVEVDDADEGDDEGQPRKNARKAVKGKQKGRKKGTAKLEVLKTLPVEMLTEVRFILSRRLSFAAMPRALFRPELTASHAHRSSRTSTRAISSR